MKHELQPFAYTRYGDDFICFTDNQANAESIRDQSVKFLKETLFLTTNPKLDALHSVRNGVSYLGINFWPNDITLMRECVIELMID
jgi:hypothetical protein